MAETTTVVTEEMAVNAVNEVLRTKRKRFTPAEASTSLEALDLDSLEVAELFAALEDMCGVDLDPASAEDFDTVSDLTRLQALPE